MKPGEGGYGHSVGRLLEDLRTPHGGSPHGTGDSHAPRIWRVITKAEAAQRAKPSYVGPARPMRRGIGSSDFWATLAVSLLVLLLLFVVLNL